MHIMYKKKKTDSTEGSSPRVSMHDYLAMQRRLIIQTTILTSIITSIILVSAFAGVSIWKIKNTPPISVSTQRIYINNDYDVLVRPSDINYHTQACKVANPNDYFHKIKLLEALNLGFTKCDCPEN